MESTGIYHRPIEKFFLENNLKVFVINPIYGKMQKRNIRKTKTDKEDCFNLVNLFYTNEFKQYIKPSQLYLDMNALSRQYFALDELCVNLKNRYKNLVYLCFPEYELVFKNNTIYSEIALLFIEKYPHAEIISNTRIDCLQIFFKRNNFRNWKSKAIKIKQSGKSINIHGPISKSGNKYLRKILYVAVSNIVRLTAISNQENDIENYYKKNVMKENIITHQ